MKPVVAGLVFLLLPFSVLAADKKSGGRGKAVDTSFYLEGSDMPASVDAAPAEIRLPAAWVKALADTWNEGHKRGVEMSLCLDYGQPSTIMEKRRALADDLRKLLGQQAALTEQQGGGVEVIDIQIGKLRRQLAVVEAEGSKSNTFNTSMAEYGEATFTSLCQDKNAPATMHTHPWGDGSPSGADTLIDVKRNPGGAIAIIRGETGITLTMPTKTRTSYGFPTPNDWAYLIHDHLQFGAWAYSEESNRDKDHDDVQIFYDKSHHNNLAYVLAPYGIAFYTGGTDGVLKKVAIRKPAARPGLDRPLIAVLAQFALFAKGVTPTEITLDASGLPAAYADASTSNRLEPIEEQSLASSMTPVEHLLAEFGRASGPAELGISNFVLGISEEEFYRILSTSPSPVEKICTKGGRSPEGNLFLYAAKYSINYDKGKYASKGPLDGPGMYFQADFKSRTPLQFGVGRVTGGVYALKGFLNWPAEHEYYTGEFTVSLKTPQANGNGTLRAKGADNLWITKQGWWRDNNLINGIVRQEGTGREYKVVNGEHVR